MYTLWRKSHYIGLLAFPTHFGGNRCQWGRSFEGLRELGFMLLGFVLKHLPFVYCILLLCMVEYIEEIPLGFYCQYMQ